jgi:hypothetical protein
MMKRVILGARCATDPALRFSVVLIRKSYSKSGGELKKRKFRRSAVVLQLVDELGFDGVDADSLD